MQYAEYRKKMLKLKSVLEVVKRFRVLIICACLLVVALITTLLSVRGIVYEVADCPESIVYGENLGFKAKAVMCGIKYQYAAEGSDEWTDEKPVLAGSYKVRPWSKSVAGTPRYGKEHSFTILQKQIEVRAADTAVYGDNPALVADLAFGDSAVCDRFTYADKYAQTTDVLPDKNSVKITDKNGNDVTSCYVITTYSSEVTLTQRAITVAAESAEKEYDGTPLTAGGYDLRGTSLAFGDEIKYSGCEGSRTYAGSADNRIVGEIKIYNEDGADVTERYNLTTAYGTLTVNRRKVLVTSEDAQKEYDGEALACLKYSDDGRLLSGHKLQVTSFVGLVDAGERENLLAFIVTGGDEMDYTANYDIQLTAGTLTVTRRQITVTTQDKSWVYAGVPYSWGGHDVTAGSLVSGHISNAYNLTDITDVGTASNGCEISIFDSANKDVTANYQINIKEGKLTVTPAKLTVHSEDFNWVYDGAAHDWKGFTQSGLAEIHTATSTAISNITDVGACENKIEVKVFSGEKEVTSNYDIEYFWGQLKITPRPVTISADGAEKIYDGTALSCATLSADNLVAGHVVTGQTYGSGTDAGEYANSVKEGTAKILAADGKDVSSNYEITLADGVLKVNPRPITVITADGKWTYDGKDHSFASYKIAAVLNTALVSGHRAVMQDYTTVCDAGEFENAITIKIFAGSSDVTANYDITYDNGVLTVDPRPVTVRTWSAGGMYDGKPLTCEKYEISSSLSPVLVKDHYEKVTFTGSQIIAGQSKNTVEVKVLAGDGTDVTSNYAVSVVEGDLFVYKRDITVASFSGSWRYDGTAHARQAFDVKGYGLAAGDAAVVDTATGIINVGTAQNVITVKILRDGTDVTSSYDITYEYGTLTITARPVTVTADSAEKQYDGTPLTCETVSGTSLVPVTGHTITARTTGSQTEVGQSANRVVSGTVIIRDENGIDVTSNYSVTLADGVLKVTQRELTIRAGDAQKIYDGDPLTSPLYEITSETKLLAGHKLTAQTYGSQTDAGEGANAVVPSSVTITDAYGRNVRSQYLINFEEGLLTVAPRAITVVAGDAQKEYDGTPLTCGNFEVFSIYNPALVKDHKATAVISGSQTAAGVGANTIDSVTITSSSGDVTANYAIVLQDGTLTVTGKKITVTTESGEWVYDGKDHNLSGFTCEGLLEGHTATNDYLHYFNDAGEYSNYNSVKIFDGEEDITGCYDITYVYGTVTVKKREVHLTAADGEWVYDGEAHTKEQAEVDGDSPYGWVEGHTVEYCDAAEIITFGEVENAFGFKVMDGEHEVTSSYDLHLTCGTLKITKRPVTVTYAYDNIYFTGAPLNQVVASSRYLTSVSEYPLLGGTYVMVTVLCDEYALGEATLYFQEGSAKIVDGGLRDYSENYEITLLPKKVNIVKRDVRIESVEAEKVYDGTPLTAEEYQIYKHTTSSYPFVSNATVEGHEVELSVTFTGSQTQIGESLNTFTVDGFKVVDADGNDITYGYDHYEVYGGLYVTRFGSLYVTTGSAEKVYDGTPLVNGDYRVRSTLLDGYTYEIFVTGSRTEVGTSYNTFDVVVYSPEGVDVTDGLRLVDTLGRLTVLERETDGNHGTFGDLNLSGSISGGGNGGGIGGIPEAPNQVALRLYSEIGGKVYMRLQSYGAYTGSGWTPANPYMQTIDGKYGMNYLTGFALGGAGRKSYNMKVDVMGSMYYLPYYLDSGDYGYRIQQSDVLYTGDTGVIYSLNYYPYDYLKEGAVKINGESLSAAELEYRQFVYENYLSVPRTTAEYLESVIAAQGFSTSDGALVAKIAAYVQNAAAYNLKYNTALDNETDAVVSFLRDYKEGVCRHYASAATLLYRMMGIPARYTVGYTGETVAGEWVDVTTENGHAWVEIYVDGTGWVQIEVTGSDNSDYGEIELGTLNPADVTKEYDGSPLVANRLAESSALAWYLNRGYTYDAQFGGSQTNVGTSYSWVTNFTLYAPDGKPILKDVHWTSGAGKLTVVKPGTLITVHLYYLGVEYDGRAHSLGKDDWYTEGMPAGFRMEFDPSSISVTDADGFRWDDLKKLPLHLYNANNFEVTDNYNIIFSHESEQGSTGEGIDISRRKIRISTQTAEKEYDGTPLTNGGWWISFGTLAEGHKVSVTLSGSITDAGETLNRVKSCIIYDKDGRDVTENYSLTYILGTLTVID